MCDSIWASVGTQSRWLAPVRTAVRVARDCVSSLHVSIINMVGNNRRARAGASSSLFSPLCVDDKHRHHDSIDVPTHSLHSYRRLRWWWAS